MVGLAVMPVLGQAQTGADSVAVVEAAARWYASRMPASSRIGFLMPRRSGDTPTGAQLEAAQRAAQALGATLLPRESLSAKLCDHDKPGDCGSGKVEVIVDVRLREFTGNTGEVLVMETTKKGPGPRLEHAVRGWTVLFVRSGGGWAFNRVLRMSMS